MATRRACQNWRAAERDRGALAGRGRRVLEDNHLAGHLHGVASDLLRHRVTGGCVAHGRGRGGGLKERVPPRCGQRAQLAGQDGANDGDAHGVAPDAPGLSFPAKAAQDVLREALQTAMLLGQKRTVCRHDLPGVAKTEDVELLPEG